MAITMEMENEDEEAWMSTYNLLTWKPVIYAANVAEGDLADDGESNSHVQAVRKYAAEQNSEIFVICAEIEEEISELDDDEKKMFLEDLGLTESGLEKLVKASYHLLGLMSFLTSGEDETRAWTIKIGTKAPQAAGKIHTDFERKIEKAIKESETKIENLEKKLKVLNEKMCTPEGASDMNLVSEYTSVNKQLSEEEDIWTNLSEELDEQQKELSH